MATLAEMLAQMFGIPGAQAQAAGAPGGMPTDPGIEKLLSSLQFAPPGGGPGGIGPDRNALLSRGPMPMAPAGPGASGAAGGGLLDLLKRMFAGGGAASIDPTGNDRPAVDLRRAAPAPVHTDSTGRVRIPPSLAAGNEGNERSGVPDDMLTQLRNAMSAAMPAPPNAPANLEGMDERPSRYVAEGGGLQPNVPPFRAPQTRVATDQDPALAENIMRGAEQAQAQREAANPLASGNLVNTLTRVLGDALKSMPQNPNSRLGAFAGAAGEVGRQGDARRRLKIQEARTERADTRAERGDARAERADTRAAETHRLNVTKLADEIRRRIGGALTPEQMLRVDQIAATLFRSSRSGAMQEATPEQVINAVRQYRNHILGQYGLSTAPSPRKGSVQQIVPGTSTAPPAPAPTTGARPPTAPPASGAASGTAPGASVPMGGTFTTSGGEVYRRVGPGNTQADWQLVP